VINQMVKNGEIHRKPSVGAVNSLSHEELIKYPDNAVVPTVLLRVQAREQEHEKSKPKLTIEQKALYERLSQYSMETMIHASKTLDIKINTHNSKNKNELMTYLVLEPKQATAVIHYLRKHDTTIKENKKNKRKVNDDSDEERHSKKPKKLADYNTSDEEKKESKKKVTTKLQDSDSDSDSDSDTNATVPNLAKRKPPVKKPESSGSESASSLSDSSDSDQSQDEIVIKKKKNVKKNKK